MVEIEISVLSRQCLDQWIPAREKVIAETRAWEKERNYKRTKVYWQFTIPNARVKLHRFYPLS
jgi:nuclear transport factor 2 (NTF2) superfamily protein